MLIPVHIHLSNPPAKANVLHATMITSLRVSPSDLKVEWNIIRSSIRGFVSGLLTIEMEKLEREERTIPECQSYVYVCPCSKTPVKDNRRPVHPRSFACSQPNQAI
jgi:hypothetical protein